MRDESKIDLFHPQQPRIPGVSDAGLNPVTAPEETAELDPPAPAAERLRSLVPLLWFMLTVAGIVTTGAGLLLWSKKATSKPVAASQPIAAVPTSTAPPPKDIGGIPVAPGPVATTEELAKPWSSKQFLFRNPVTHDPFPAVLVRLPGGTLWALSLRQPFGDCNLEYVTSSQKLQTDYHLHATHPMMVAPCNGTVFDLTQYGEGPNGLVRGEIIAGTAVRPPVAIEIQTRGKEIIATRSE